MACLASAMVGCDRPDGPTVTDRALSTAVSPLLPEQLELENCAGPARPVTRRQAIIDIAVSQWRRFGYPAVSALRDGENILRRPDTAVRDAFLRRILTAFPGSSPPVGEYGISSEKKETGQVAVSAYWSIVDAASIHGGSPWSAAFVSWVMCASGADKSQFPPSASHARYFAQALAAGDDAELIYRFESASDELPRAGDLVCVVRATTSPNAGSLAPLVKETTPMHCDIVVDTDPVEQFVYAIGGNVSDAVALTRFAWRDSGSLLLTLRLTDDAGEGNIRAAFR